MTNRPFTLSRLLGALQAHSQLPLPLLTLVLSTSTARPLVNSPATLSHARVFLSVSDATLHRSNAA
jgi:hypothetical protein